MGKNRILADILGKLAEMKVSYSLGNDTDISVVAEFLDTGWSTGSKKITYKTAIFVDEASGTIFMWELTKEVGHGLSFGSESGSSFQSGKTLFRKVKSVQYGLDGKAYEYTFDLGAIPKAVKETAKAYDWKFKTVLNKNKAMYPAGYVPATMPPTMNQSPHITPIQSPIFQQQPQSQDNNPQGAFSAQSKKPAPKSKAGTLGLLGFILLGMVAVILLAIGKASIVGWFVALAVLAGGLLLQRKSAIKGFLFSGILWIVTAGILFLTIGLTSNLENDARLTTANPQQMTTKVNNSGKPDLVPVKSGGAINLNVDDLNLTDYFQKILDQVKIEWKSDAQIISIRMDKTNEKNFNSLAEVKVDSNWKIIFYSLSTMNEAVVDLDNSQKNSQGVPIIRYQTEQAGALTMAEIKNKGAKIYEFNRPETAKTHQKIAANCLIGCNMKMSEILKLLSERFKNEQSAEKGYYLTINGINGPKLDIYWENGGVKNRFFIDLDTKKSYDKQL